MLYVRVLQSLAMDDDGTPLPLPRSRRSRSLLGWLALHPGMHPRARVAERFWPDVPESTSRNSLRQALWELRAALGDHARHLVATRDEVGLVPGPGLWVDHWEFGSLLSQGRLDDALDLTGGVLLEDIDDEWAYETREEHRRQLVEVMSCSASEAEAAGDMAKAVERSRQLVQLDPYGEEGHRQLMRRLAAARDVPAALLVCERLRDRLRRDLALPLSPETRSLAERLRAGLDESNGAAAPAVVPALPPPPPDEPFVGRDAELGRLLAMLDITRQGRRRIVLVEGDPGIGKTRLAIELCRGAQARGATVLFGRCTEETLVPYQPFVEALRRQVLGTPADQLRAALPPDAGELLPLLPEIAARVPVANVGAAAEPAVTDRYRLFEATVGLLHGLTTAASAVLVLDDLHWADPPSLLLLRHLARSPAQGALLVVGTYRAGELDGSLPLQEALADLQHQLVERVHLTGLPTGGVAALVSGRTGRAASAALVRMIEARTGGNPFFIGEVLRNLTESGALSLQADGPVWDLASRDTVIPEGINEVISRRILRLGQLGRRVLEAGSVAGQEFHRHVVAAVVAVDPDEVLDVLDSAVRARLVEEMGESGRYAFAHPMVREVLYHGLSVNRRALLHERVGEALEKMALPGTSQAELARHFLLAHSSSTLEKAIGHALEAAEQAMRQRAYEEAVTLLDHTLDRLPAGDRTRRRRVLSRRAVAHTAAFHAIIEPRRLPTATAGGSAGQEKR